MKNLMQNVLGVAMAFLVGSVLVLGLVGAL